MQSKAIGTAIAAGLLGLSSLALAQSSPSQPNVGGSGVGSVQSGPGGNVGTGSTIGTPSSVTNPAASGGGALGSSRCSTMVGSERERCMLQERASGGATVGAPGTSTTTPSTTTTTIPSTGTTGAGSTGMGSGTSTGSGSLGSTTR